MEESGYNTLIELRDVDIMRDENLILTGVSLNIKKNDFVYLIGRVGSGKTSIMKTLIAETPIKLGEATVSGFNLRTLRERDKYKLRRRLGVVYQDLQLLSDRSVYSNLKFVLQSTGWRGDLAMDRAIKAKLEIVGMALKAHKMPYQLSGGEQQKVAIARALLNEPEIIMADEPTGNLDPQTTNEIMEILMRIHETTHPAIMIITHNTALIEKYPGRVLICEDSRCREMDSLSNCFVNM